jgi:hypothetical protein
MNTTAAVLGMLMLAISASAKHKPEPEPASVEISASPAVVKQVILKGLLRRGFALDSEAEHQITVTRPMPAAMTIISQLLQTPSACQVGSMPKYVYIFNIVGLAENSTFVSVTGSYDHAGAFCRNVREPLDSGKMRTSLGNALQELKAACEKDAPAVSSAPMPVVTVPLSPAVQQTTAVQPEPVVLATPQPESLGDAARRVRASKEAK